MMGSRTLLKATAAVVSLLLVVGVAAGCGSDAESSKAAEEPTDAETSRTAEEPTGEPLVIMTVADETQPNGNTNPEFSGAVRARAEAVNSNGGVNGRPIEVHSCDSKLDPNATLACAREAVDKDAVAVIGGVVNFEDNFLAVMEENQIPVIGMYPATNAAYTSPVSFPTAAGVVGAFLGLGRVLADAGATKAALIMFDLGPASGFIAQVTEMGAELAGIEYATTVILPPDATDLAPYVASATKEGVDGLISWIPGQGYIGLLRELRASGYRGHNATFVTATSGEELAEAGEASEGLLAVSSVTPPGADAEGIRMFSEDMESFDSDLKINEFSIQFWAATWLFERVAAGLDTVDRASVLKAMGELEDFDMGGVMPNITTTEAFSDLPEGLPDLTRVFVPAVTTWRLEGADFVTVNEDAPFFNPFVPSAEAA